MERPFDDAAMLHFIRDCLFRSDSPLHHEFSSSLAKFIAERMASRESEWFPCISRDLHSLSQKLADTQAKVIELEQRIDALHTSAANATMASDHRVDILQSSTENATQAAVSELRKPRTCTFAMLCPSQRVCTSFESTTFESFPVFTKTTTATTTTTTTAISFELSAVFTVQQFTLSTATTTSTTTSLRPVDEYSEPNETSQCSACRDSPSQSSECRDSTCSKVRDPGTSC